MILLYLDTRDGFTKVSYSSPDISLAMAAILQPPLPVWNRTAAFSDLPSVSRDLVTINGVRPRHRRSCTACTQEPW
jgi:hypothetical protein